MLSSTILTTLLLVVTLAIHTAVAGVARVAGDTIQYKNAVYYADWDQYERGFLPASMPAQCITDVLFAFATFDGSGTVTSRDPLDDRPIGQLHTMKSDNSGMKVLLSIGGWTDSPRFGAMASTDSGRQTFAATAVDLMTQWGMDGLDLDWEWPDDATKAANMLELLRAMRTQLDNKLVAYPTANTNDYKFTLSISLPVAAANYQFMNLAAMDQIVDQFNVQAYDFAGAWTQPAAHAANLLPNPYIPAATPFNTDAAIAYYLAGGLTASKITLGMPLYGRAFDNTAGIGEPYDHVSQGSWEVGIWDYKALPRPGAQVLYDETAVAAYSYDSATHQLISYDTPQSVQAKIQYLKTKGLGGAMFWEASGDKTGSDSLVMTACNALGNLDIQS
ncbi:glycoside hydrolase superfamily [Xylariaceae sp. FL1272]|nr:glycoside hydrolase superfamily [Xylariaceae sp. FL1272]